MPTLELTPINPTPATIEFASFLPPGAIMPYAGSSAPDDWLLCDGSAVSRTDYALLFEVIGTTYGSGDGSTTFNVPNLKGKIPVGLDAAQTEFDTLGETGGAKTHTLTEAELASHEHTVDSHSHSDGTLAVASHSHSDGTLAVAAHSHGVTDPGHAHGPAAATSYAMSSAAFGTTPGSGLGSVEAYAGTTAGATTGISTQNASPDVTGSTGSETPDVTGSTGSASPDTDAAGSGTAHNNLQPYMALNYLIKV